MMYVIIFTSFSTCLLMFLLMWIYKRYEKQQILKKYGIPGPEPHLLLGNFGELKASQTPNEVIARWLKQYGDTFGYFVGSVPFVVVRDLESLKQIMIKDFHNFMNRPKMFIQMKPLTETLLCMRSQRWKDARGVLTPAFSSAKIKMMMRAIDNKVTTTVEVVNEKAKLGEEFNMYELVQGLTLDVIAECALAMKTNCQRNPEDDLLRAVRIFFDEGHNDVVKCAIMFPFLATLLAFVNKFVTFGEVTAMSLKSVKEAIDFRRENPHLRGSDFLQLMLDAAETDNTSDGFSSRKVKSAKLADDEIIANAFLFLLAGYETTATALAFTFHILIQNPDVQEKLHVEISEHLKDDEELTYETLQNMQYLDQVFNESLRLYPPVVTFVSRECQTDYKIGKYVVPNGAIVQVPVWEIHHDPEIWPDPWKYDPDRFSNENKGKISNLAFVPFGVGQRNCIGMRFSQLEAKTALARLVKKFRFVSSEKSEAQLTLKCPTVVINPAKGVYLRAVLRDQSSDIE